MTPSPSVSPSKRNGSSSNGKTKKKPQQQQQQQQQQAVDSSSVQVAIKVRPMLAFEAGSTQCVEVLSNTSDGGMNNICRIGGEKGPTFCFDAAFDGLTKQEHFYSQCVVPLITSCLEGYNATTLAYGQTGSGKTFTMTGPTTTMQDGPMAGIIPRAIQSLFTKLKEKKKTASTTSSTSTTTQADNDDDYEYTVRIQFLELYGEEIRDLLSKETSKSLHAAKLTIRDVGLNEPEVLGATQHVVDCAEEALLCLARGMMRRVTASTAMNASSSRSHAILSVLVEQRHHSQQLQICKSKFNFVDLAGSERQKRTKASGQRLKEGIDINKGLLVLGNVISALGDPKKAGKTFVPYRDSKLTRLLKGSLGGNHKTLMIACVSPSSNNLEESLNCLRYANRAKNIQNNAVVNVDAGTKLMMELKFQVSQLAGELLKYKEIMVTDGDDDEQEDTLFSVEMLQGLVDKNGDVVAAAAATKPLASPIAATPQRPSLRRNPSFHTPGFAQVQQTEQLRIAESQLDQTRLQLKQTTDECLSMTEDLFTIKAEKELYRLKLQDGGDAAAGGGGDKAFLEKAIAYEREIATLKEAVQASCSIFDDNYENGDETKLAQASKSLQQDKQQLQLLQSQLLSVATNDSEEGSDDGMLGSPEMDGLKSQVLRSMSASTQLEAEEVAADAELTAITKKFLNDDDDDDAAAAPEEEEPNGRKQQQQQQLQANLVELSSSIQEKETLITQLEQTQKKYSTMRDFYESKLKQMQDQVHARELEREALKAELLKNSTTTPSGDLQERLRDKERHIFNLKKRQGELYNLTKVSTRNEAQITKLKDEIKAMKHKKVDLQKLVNAERKSHVGQVNRLKKEVMQRDREANKWKHISNKKAVEAEKAHQVAKARLEQLGALKVKYTEAEKKLRVKTVKRGVMEKAGLDSVIVGRKTVSAPKKQQQQRAASSVNIDSVRDFLDRKVADISKKEALADKLAHEWEDHLELVTKRHQLSESRRVTRATAEAIKNINVQITYKEERIRKLAEKIGKQEHHVVANNSKKEEPPQVFFEDDEFKKLLPNSSTLAGAKLTSRILFGMVVRERRRVATLARTASSLNAKAAQAEAAAAEKEAAFRSFQDEERLERATLAQSQQEQILSLMAMVKDDSMSAMIADLSFEERRLHESMPTIGVSASTISSPRMALLANERVEVLERQLEELQGERESMETYKKLESTRREELAEANKEKEALRQETAQLRETLRVIRDEMAARKSEDDASSSVEGEILGVVKSAMKTSKARRRKSVVTPHYAATDSDDDDDDEDVPEWAGDIMADLAIIADGHMPDALKESPIAFEVDETVPQDAELESKDAEESKESEPKEQKRSVFDRLTNPINFTGVQKRKTEQQKRNSGTTLSTRDASRGASRASAKGRNQEERKALSAKVSEQLDGFFQGEDFEPAAPPPTKNRKSRDSKEETEHRSVFERLLSPSNYTGTQKEKMQKVQEKKSHEADVLLDELLASKHGVNRVVSPPTPPTELDVPPGRKPPEDITKKVANKVSEYAQKDVFERLQQSTTQSYAVKKHHGPRSVPSPSRAMSAENEVVPRSPKSPTTPSRAAASPLRDSRSGYTQLNVFERLQTTTTEAFAKKKNSGEAPPLVPLSPKAADAGLAVVDDDPNGVFERLQKTTTHSFAGKHLRHVDEEP